MKKRIVCVLFALMIIFNIVACTEESVDENGESSAYTLDYQSQTIKIDGEANAIIAALGTPQLYEELPTCGKGDLDKLYQFGSIRIRTYQINGRDYFSVIEIMDDLIKTREGVAIGDTQDAVQNAYGEADEKTVGAWTYHAKGMDLEVYFNDSNLVKSIVYRGEN